MCSRVLSFVLTAALYASEASARFLDSDADHVDDDRLLLSETFNDAASYRWPLSWERLWAKHTLGWRVNAGSLDINHFDYLEDIKLRADAPNAPLAVAYTQTRREDFVEQRLEREIRVEAMPWSALRLAFLADGGSLKEYGDMGAALAWAPDPQHVVEVYYWDPDLYYTTKKSDPNDRIVHRTHTRGLRGTWDFALVEATFDASEDWPLVWERPSRGYRYEYERRLATARLAVGENLGWSAYVSGSVEHKRERKDWVDRVEAMRRDVRIVESGVVHAAPEHERVVALESIGRDWAGVTDAQTWRELGLYATDHFPLTDDQFFQLGLHANRGRVPERKREARYEVKLQTAIDQRIGQHGGILLNATWDLDQLERDFPYRKNRFKPWGGGDLQLFVIF